MARSRWNTKRPLNRNWLIWIQNNPETGRGSTSVLAVFIKTLKKKRCQRLFGVQFLLNSIRKCIETKKICFLLNLKLPVVLKTSETSWTSRTPSPRAPKVPRERPRAKVTLRPKAGLGCQFLTQEIVSLFVSFTNNPGCVNFLFFANKGRGKSLKIHVTIDWLTGRLLLHQISHQFSPQERLKPKWHCECRRWQPDPLHKKKPAARISSARVVWSESHKKLVNNQLLGCHFHTQSWSNRARCTRERRWRSSFGTPWSWAKQHQLLGSLTDRAVPHFVCYLCMCFGILISAEFKCSLFFLTQLQVWFFHAQLLVSSIDFVFGWSLFGSGHGKKKVSFRMSEDIFQQQPCEIVRVFMCFFSPRFGSRKKGGWIPMLLFGDWCFSHEVSQTSDHPHFRRLLETNLHRERSWTTYWMRIKICGTLMWKEKVQDTPWLQQLWWFPKVSLKKEVLRSGKKSIAIVDKASSMLICWKATSLRPACLHHVLSTILQKSTQNNTRIFRCWRCLGCVL